MKGNAMDLSAYLLSDQERAVLDARKRGILGDGEMLNDGSVEFPVVKSGTIDIVGPVFPQHSTVTLNYKDGGLSNDYL